MHSVGTVWHDGDGVACKPGLMNNFGPAARCKEVWEGFNPDTWKWIGTAPACRAKPEDCEARGYTYVRSDKHGGPQQRLTQYPRLSHAICAPISL